ncbi:MAG: pyridoxal phosphate-dependent aminotransferase [Myxococcota bacterium]
MSLPARPELPAHIRSMRPSFFARMLERLATYRGEVFTFHIGDASQPPPLEVQSEAARAAADPSVYRYGHPLGEASLRQALTGWLNRRHGLGLGLEEVLICTGATAGLSIAAETLLHPGDEVLLCTPCWPLIRGVVQKSAAVPVEVDLTQELYRRPGADVVDLLTRRMTPRTRALYFTSPNNPDGKVLDRAALNGLAEVSIRHNLWVLFDAAYMDFSFVGEMPLISTLPGMEERTVTVGTFSKTFGMAGMRVGWLGAHKSVMAEMRKVANHTNYHVNAIAQRMALKALELGDAPVDEMRARTRAARDLCLKTLTLATPCPEGGAYIFPDLSNVLKGREVMDLLLYAVDRGVVMAPGDGFGQSYERHARLCYTAMPQEMLRRGLDRVNEVLESYARAEATGGAPKASVSTSA